MRLCKMRLCQKINWISLIFIPSQISSPKNAHSPKSPPPTKSPIDREIDFYHESYESVGLGRKILLHNRIAIVGWVYN